LNRNFIIREFWLTSVFSPSGRFIDQGRLVTLLTLLTHTYSGSFTGKQRDGDKLAEAEQQIDWERIRPIIKPMYTNDTPRGGQPNMDEVLMVKLLVLQAWYGLSDPELERQVNDRLSFRHFLGYPERAPDYSTVWQFRERLAETGRDRLVWAELQRQLAAKGLRVRKGVVQDASFITSDPGHARADKPRGDEAKTRHSKDGTWTKKGGKSYFGYKLHMKRDGFI